MEAGPAEADARGLRVLLDDGGLQAELGGADRGDVATVAGTEDDNICIDLDGEDDTALIPFDWLADAKLVLTDALMKRGAAIRAARGEPEDDGLPEGAPDEATTDTKTPSEDNA